MTTESNDQDMMSQIEDYLRIGLSAKHRATNQIIHFPLIHIVVESYANHSGQKTFIATCLEFSQAFEGDKPQTAVAGVIKLMHDYFLTVLKKEGMNFISEELEKNGNEILWGKVRRYLAEKFKSNLLFVEKSFDRRTTKAELMELAKDIIQPYEENEVVSKDHHEKVTSLKDETIKKQNELILNILQVLSYKTKQIKEQKKKISILTNGLEGGLEEWTEQEPDIQIPVPSSVS
ncbi:hypothetical protein [Leptospira noguchii]|uniref:Uncharacterized protein n=1 Tax=Leptospira noguchii TaxID=28182 RepID=M6VLB4_9LEPT|nr:hypothetical protein [Leptospira noguchii]EMO53874.1 hypothetical protein LEP1GSC172_3281 [Leptospira noguchii]